jgi:hypothetical protein
MLQPLSQILHSERATGVLMKHKRTLRLFSQFTPMALQIEDPDTRLLWLEATVITCDLWDVQDHRILSQWSS